MLFCLLILFIKYLFYADQDKKIDTWCKRYISSDKRNKCDSLTESVCTRSRILKRNKMKVCRIQLSYYTKKGRPSSATKQRNPFLLEKCHRIG